MGAGLVAFTRFNLRMNDSIELVMDQPTPFMQRAFQYTRSLGKGRSASEVEADAYVADDQSVVVKYHFGEDDVNIRLPGDVGLAMRQVLIPFPDNIQHTKGVSLNRYGSVPGGFMDRLYPEDHGPAALRACRRKALPFFGHSILLIGVTGGQL